MTTKLVQNRRPRIFEADIPISGPLDVPFGDMPAQVQDTILAALERTAERAKCPIAIVGCRYKTDPDKTPDQPGYHYLHVVASEVVEKAEDGTRTWH